MASFNNNHSSLFQKATFLAIDCSIGLLLLIKKEMNYQIMESLHSGLCCCNLIIHYLSLGDTDNLAERKNHLQKHLRLINEQSLDDNNVLEDLDVARKEIEKFIESGNIESFKAKEVLEAIMFLLPKEWKERIDFIINDIESIWDEVAEHL